MGHVWWGRHKNSITACYLKYSCYTNTSTASWTACMHTLQLSLHWSNQESVVLQGPIKSQYPVFFSLLLWVVRLKSNKYQPEHLTSVSHFKRTTAETTFGLQVD